MSCANLYASQLHQRGFRLTGQRLAILNVLLHSGSHLSPGEVLKQARRSLPGLTEPTVYRTLEFLVKNGLAQAELRQGGHLVYQIASYRHQHVVCRACGDELEVESKILEKAYRELEAATGYALMDAHTTFFGLCPQCRRSESG